jgi:hypothetical protein
MTALSSLRIKAALAVLLATAALALFVQSQPLNMLSADVAQQLAALPAAKPLAAGAHSTGSAKPPPTAPESTSGAAGNAFTAQLLANAKRHDVHIAAETVSAPAKSEYSVSPPKTALTASMVGSYIKVKALLAEMSTQFPTLALEQVALTKQSAAEGSAQAGVVKAEVRWALYSDRASAPVAAAVGKP